MAQYVKQGDIFGRLGSGIGQGVAEQLPKEIARSRLSSGLQDLEKNGAGLTPSQYFNRSLQVPGVAENPQLIHTLGELAKQENRGRALIDQSKGEKKEKNFPLPKNTKDQVGKKTQESPSITTRNPIEATLNPYIPRSYDEILQGAAQKFDNNKALYNNDPQLALNAEIQEDQQNQNINKSLQGQRLNEQNVQNIVTQGLQKQRKARNAIVPENVYQDIEDKAINAVRPKSQGGEGLTEQEAEKKYGKDLDAISKDYEAVKTVGVGKILTKTPQGNKDALRSIRNKFKERDDLENLAKTYISENGLSPSKAYYLAKPVTDFKDLNNSIKNTPKLSPKVVNSKGFTGVEIPDQKEKTLKVSEKIAPLLGKKGSPLAVAEELKSRGYDPKEWMDYLDKNRKKLGFTEEQARELDYPRDFQDTIDDLWMFYMSGLDDLVEQK